MKRIRKAVYLLAPAILTAQLGCRSAPSPEAQPLSAWDPDRAQVLRWRSDHPSFEQQYALEASGLAATVVAADKAVKAAKVSIVEIRLGDGLGGTGTTHLTGAVHDVQAAVEAGLAAVTRPNVTVRHTVIPAVDEALRQRIDRSTAFYEESGGRD